MLLNTLNQTLTYKTNDSTIKPAESATVTVQRCGATVRTTVSHTAGGNKSVDIEGVNTIADGETLQLDTDAATTCTVDNIDYNNRRLKVTIPVDTTFTKGDRLWVVDSTVVLWETEWGEVRAADNNLTTDANGAIKAYTMLQQLDLMVSGSMYDADFILPDVQIPMTQHFTPRHFGAQGSNQAGGWVDELGIIQFAIETLADWGINTIYIDRSYAVNGTLTLPAGFTIVGENRTDSYIWQISTSLIYTFDDEGNGGATLRGFRTNGTGSSRGATFSGVRAMVDDVDMGFDVALNGEAGADDLQIRYSKFYGATKGIVLTDCPRARIESCDIASVLSGGTALEVNAVTTTLDGLYIGGNTTLECVINTGGAQALDVNGTATYGAQVTIGGLYVKAGLVDFTYSEVMTNGFRCTSTDITLDSSTKGNFVGTLNDNILPAYSNGEPGGTPTVNTFPMRWDADNNKLWIHNGSAWVAADFGTSTAQLESGSQYVSGPLATAGGSGTYSKMLGTFTAVGSTGDIVVSTSNRLQHTGATTKKFYVSFTFSMSGATPADLSSFRLYHYVDGVSGSTLVATQIDRYIGGTDVGAAAISGIIELAQNDYVELWGTRVGAANFQLDQGQFVIVEIGVV